jgi:hypothetical protein
MNKQVIELGFLSDRFLKWAKINFTLTPIISSKVFYKNQFKQQNGGSK